MTDTATNRFLSGPYAPVTTEETAVDLRVTGTLPPELDGRYLRNGPNPIGEVDPATYHWFLGDGMVHGLRLRDGKADWYRNRWVRGAAVADALGEERVPGAGSFGDTANTNVIGLAGRTFAIVEAGGPPAELTDELDTVCFGTFDGTFPNGFTAHPKKDPVTGDLHAVNYYWARPDVVEYLVVGPDATMRHRVDVPVPGNPMVHDCSITETSVVIYDLPVTFNLDDAMGGARFPYAWDPGYGARVGIMPLYGSPEQVQWFEVEPCYVFHPVNAFDDGDTVVIDVARHPRMFDKVRNGPDEGVPELWRWTFDRTSGKAHEEQLDDHPVEFPRVDERLVGRRHRYALTAGLGYTDDELAWPTSTLVRYDRANGGREIIDFGPGQTAGEAVFVPRHQTAAEDDGWYLTLVTDVAHGTSELVVLDASAPTEGPVARVHIPARIPLGFHGNWVPTAR
ncbi:carotenoid oxygenase family protein [Aquihabitans sp. McL0605]|uniref:carotenoid oxygenase family protein n=1 Tax=Aquihabitans sp. McL0605 TaxID=3415671 RepID=UPI003CF92541